MILPVGNATSRRSPSSISSRGPKGSHVSAETVIANLCRTNLALGDQGTHGRIHHRRWPAHEEHRLLRVVRLGCAANMIARDFMDRTEAELQQRILRSDRLSTHG